MKCWKRGSPPKAVNRKKETSNKGNGTAEFKDTHGMERGKDNIVTKSPEWDGPSRVVAE